VCYIFIKPANPYNNQIFMHNKGNLVILLKFSFELHFVNISSIAYHKIKRINPYILNKYIVLNNRIKINKVFTSNPVISSSFFIFFFITKPQNKVECVSEKIIKIVSIILIFL